MPDAPTFTSRHRAEVVTEDLSHFSWIPRNLQPFFKFPGTQTGLRNYGYTGPCDGIPGTNTYMAMQLLVSYWGYNGAIDGELGPNSYKGLAKYFNTL